MMIAASKYELSVLIQEYGRRIAAFDLGHSRFTDKECVANLKADVARLAMFAEAYELTVSEKTKA